MKSSFSLSSLRSAPAPHGGRCDQLERPYHSLTKKRSALIIYKLILIMYSILEFLLNKYVSKFRRATPSIGGDSNT